MRLRWGPHATKLAEQVLLRDPYYVVDALAQSPESVLADVFRDLIASFDARAFTCRCVRCRRSAEGVCVYPGSVELIGFCERCVLVSTIAAPRPAMRIGGYEDAVRHVALSFPRGRRANMRRIVGNLALAKGGPHCLTETAAVAFVRGAKGPSSAVSGQG